MAKTLRIGIEDPWPEIQEYFVGEMAALKNQFKMHGNKADDCYAYFCILFYGSEK
jgi:hypothetical protein